jgi:hypothetical protein
MALAAGALLVAMVPGVASAAVDEFLPDGACPPATTGFELIPFSVASIDRNGDGYACRWFFIAGGNTLLIDNNRPL